MRAFGNVAAQTERFYEAQPLDVARAARQDLRYGWRGLRQSPAFLADHRADARRRPRPADRRLHRSSTPTCCGRSPSRDPASLHRIGWRAHDDGGSRLPLAATTRSCATAAISSTRSSPRTRASSSSDGRTLVGGVRLRQLLRGAGAAHAARPRARCRPTRARRSAVLSAPGVGAALRRRSAACSAATIDLDGRPFIDRRRRRRRSSPASTTIRATSGSRSRPTPTCCGRLLGRTRRQRDSRAFGRDTAAQAQGALTPTLATARRREDRDRREVRADVVRQRDAEPAVARAARRALAGVRRVRARARHGVRQRVERHAVARDRAAARDRRAPVARREPRARRPAAADRRAADRRARRRRRRWRSRRGRCGPAIVVLFSTLPPSLAALLRVAPLDLRPPRLPLRARASRRPRRCCSRWCRRCRRRGWR